jgi:hypothetical protein
MRVLEEEKVAIIRQLKRLFTVCVATVLFSSFAYANAAEELSLSGQPAQAATSDLAATAFANARLAPGGVDVALGGRNEPTIVVDPTNGNNIVVGRLFAIRVSTDGGATFPVTTNAPVPATHTRSGDPSLAFDSQGRLFWTYLGTRTTNGNIDVFVAQVNPTTGAVLAGYPVNLTTGAGFGSATAGNCNDKQWLAADRTNSGFQDQLYVVWTRFTGAGCTGPTQIHSSFSVDQGLNWSAGLTLSAAGEGFVWPSHNAVAANGDVYISYHSQPTFANNAPDGTSGQIFVLRSTDGGATYPQKNTAYAGGNADITFNVQTSGRTLNQSASWTQGSGQAWVLPDPNNAANVYVVASDDPTNTNHGANFDDMDVFIVRSTNSGVNWGAPAQVDAGAVGTTQAFPTAGIDELTGCIAVTWYDTRAAATNAGGNFLLDVFMRTSIDGGLTFSPEVQINDTAFDPDLGAGARFAGPPPTLRIGEYNGVALDGGLAHTVWTGNTATAQQILYDNNPVCDATVNVEKKVDAQPDGNFDDDPSGWTFDVVGDGQPTQVTDNTGLLTFSVPTGIYAVNETAGPAGFWRASASCVDDTSGAAVGTPAGNVAFESPMDVGVTSVTLSAGQSVTCTFENEKDEAFINIVKTVDAEPDGVFDNDPSGWSFDVVDDGESDQTTDGTGLLTFVVRADTYDVTETSQPAADTGLWLVNSSCTDDSDGSSIGTEVIDALFGPALADVAVTGVAVAAGQSITCIFENQKMAGFLTGGGNISEGRGKNGLRISFGGNVGVALDGTFHGQWQTVFQAIGNASLARGNFHSTVIDAVLFGSVNGEEPDPPDAEFNSATFVTTGRLDGQVCVLTVLATDHGEPARGKNGGADFDSIQLKLDCPDDAFDYDSLSDFASEEGDLHNLDAGDLQIHPPRE